MAGIDRRKGETTLIVELARGHTVEAAATAAGVSVTAAHRRLREPAFRTQVDIARREFWTRSIGVLAEATVDAAACLRDLLHSPLDMARLGAAKAVLESAQKGIDMVELEARLRALEEQAAAVDTDRRGRWSA